MDSTARLYSYDFRSARTYWFTVAFIVGNLLLPRLVHFVPDGGPMLLPIYFFTLIGAYKYGLRVGLLTAVLSPLINSLLFGMPPVAVLPAILAKSTLLALAASLMASKTGKISLLNLIAVVAVYQIAGTFAEWALTGSFSMALQDFRIGWPGMLIQVIGGYGLLKAISRW